MCSWSSNTGTQVSGGRSEEAVQRLPPLQTEIGECDSLLVAWPSLYPWPVDEPLSEVSGFRLHRPSPRKFSKSIFTSYQSHLGTEKNTMRVCLGKM